MREEPTVVYTDYLGMLIREQLSKIASEQINSTDDIPDGIYWFCRCNIHK